MTGIQEKDCFVKLFAGFKVCKIHLEGTKITSEATNGHVDCYVRLEGLARIITYKGNYRAKWPVLRQLLRLLLVHQRKEVTHHLTKNINFFFFNSQLKKKVYLHCK